MPNVQPAQHQEPGTTHGELADLLEARRDEILSILIEVSTYRAAVYEFESALATLRGAETEIAAHRPPRLERLAVFMPSNVLFYSYVLYGLVPAAYVDEVVVRPASHVRETARKLHQLVGPLHQFRIVFHDVTQRQFVEELVPTAGAVVFTGAYQNAEKIRSKLRGDQVMFFLGSGINPIVVTEHADILSAVEGIVEIRLLNSGQDCLGPDAIWVHRERAEEFLRVLSARLRSLRFGDYDDPQSDYGRIHYPGILRNVAEFLGRHQALIRYGGRIHFAHHHVEPTVVFWADARSMELPEFFSPIFNVRSYDSEREVVEELNDRQYGERAMGATVFGRSKVIIDALTRRHTVTVDETLLAIDDGNAPLGGRGPMANYIAVNGRIYPEPILLSKGLSEHAHKAGQEQVA